MTAFPAKIDDASTLPRIASSISSVDGTAYNSLREAILAIETVIGINPSGIYTNCRNRLDNLEIGVANPGSVELLGDVNGTIISSVVTGLHGRPISNSSPTVGQILLWNGDFWTPVDQNPFNANGDLSGTNSNQTVTGIQSRSIANLSPNNFDILTWVSSNNRWEPLVNLGGPPSGSAGGDLSGTYPNPSVAKINGASVPIAGSLTTNHILKVSGSSSVSYGYILNSNIDTSAAIDGTKISPNFGSQNILTTGNITGNNLYVGTITPPNITSGSGAPSSIPQNGSLYMRTDGDGVSGLYTYQSGSWNVINNFSASGDLSGSNSSQTVIKINGASVPVSGALTDGYVLKANGVSSLTYGSVNLAGGSNHVTGILPNINQQAQSLSGDLSGNTNSATVIKLQGNLIAAQSLGLSQDGYTLTWSNADGYWKANTNFTASGDLSGTNISQTVIKINGATVPISGALTDGYVLKADGPSSLTYAPVNLAGGSNHITGILPTLNQAAQSMSGDISGNTSSASVIKINGNSVSSQILGALQDGYILTWNNSDGYWKADTAPVSFTAGGDLSGTNINQNVIKINGASVPVSGALIDGYVLKADGLSSLTYAPVNLSGGSNHVTGVLPSINQQAQSLSGDLSGNTNSSTVIKLQGNSVSSQSLGASQDGYVLTWSNIDGYWKANTAAAIFTAGGDLSGSNSSQNVIKIQGRSVSSTAPSDGYILTWNNSNNDWEPSQINTNFGSQTITTTGSLNAGATTVSSILTDLQHINGKCLFGAINSPTISNASEASLYLDGYTGRMKLSVDGYAYRDIDARISITSITTSYNIDPSDRLIAVGTISSSITITLPLSPVKGDLYDIKDANGSANITNTIIIDGNGKNIDGSSTYTINDSYVSISLVYDGLKWLLI